MEHFRRSFDFFVVNVEELLIKDGARLLIERYFCVVYDYGGKRILARALVHRTAARETRAIEIQKNYL